jgi:hypothetical protein
MSSNTEFEPEIIAELDCCEPSVQPQEENIIQQKKPRVVKPKLSAKHDLLLTFARWFIKEHIPDQTDLIQNKLLIRDGQEPDLINQTALFDAFFIDFKKEKKEIKDIYRPKKTTKSNKKSDIVIQKLANIATDDSATKTKKPRTKKNPVVTEQQEEVTKKPRKPRTKKNPVVTEQLEEVVTEQLEEVTEQQEEVTKKPRKPRTKKNPVVTEQQEEVVVSEEEEVVVSEEKEVVVSEEKEVVAGEEEEVVAGEEEEVVAGEEKEVVVSEEKEVSKKVTKPRNKKTEDEPTTNEQTEPKKTQRKKKINNNNI